MKRTDKQAGALGLAFIVCHLQDFEPTQVGMLRDLLPARTDIEWEAHAVKAVHRLLPSASERDAEQLKRYLSRVESIAGAPAPQEQPR